MKPGTARQQHRRAMEKAGYVYLSGWVRKDQADDIQAAMDAARDAPMTRATEKDFAT